MNRLKWIAACTAFVLAVFFGTILLLRAKAAGATSEDVSAASIACDPTKSTLVIVVHGLAGKGDRMGTLIDLVKQEVAGAAILNVRYSSGWLSNSSPSVLASALTDSIRRQYEQCRGVRDSEYREVVLVGYSFGSLLLRQAFLFGLGDTRGNPEAISAGSRQRQDWTNHTSRIVLIAGMNRGWYLDKKLTGLRFYQRWIAKWTRPILKVAGVSGLLFAIEQGSPFVANLRIEWMEAAVQYRDSFPLVVQILGKEDEFVTRGDETDVAITKGFYFLSAGAANHTSILEVGQAGRPRDSITAGLRLDGTQLTRLATMNDSGDPVRARVRHIVFIRHGIRDDNRWATALRDQMCQSAANAGEPCWDRAPPGSAGPLTSINIDSYGYFGMLPFLFQPIRQDKMREFVDSYVEELAAAHDPHARVDFLGHSNGTYVLAAALKKYPTLRVDRVIFANSVVDRSFPWPEYATSHQVTGLVRNYTGASDWVVATFPRLFEIHKALGDLGSAGFSGFEKGAGANGNVTVAGQHGAGIDPLIWQQHANFFFASSPAPSPPSVAKSWWTENLLWKVPHVAWALVLIGIVVLSWAVFKLVDKVMPRLPTFPRRILQILVSLLVIGGLLTRI
jgi:hypothetical protein